MTILALSWPTAFLAGTTIAAVALVLSVVVWQVFETGRAGMRTPTDDERSTRP